MKEKICRFLRNYKKAFVPAKNCFGEDGTEVSERVSKKIAEVNCRRIIAISPFLLMMYVINAVLLVMHRDREYFFTAICITGVLTVFTLVMVGIICWIMFFNKIDNAREIWKFKIIYRLFWPIWFVGMAVLSYLQMENGYMGICLIATCLIINLLPLQNLQEFLVNIGVISLMITLIAWHDASDGMLISTKMEIACFVAMMMLGYLVQRMQLMLWMSREYLYMEAFVDPLTELLNRRGGNAVLAEKVREVPPEAEVGVIMFDIDYFKKYNDTFGHEAGDGCLRMVGQTIRETLQERTKLLIRHGGEEFAVFLFDTDEEELREWAEKLRMAVYGKQLEAPVKDVADYVTVSVGTSIKKVTSETLRYEDLLIEADAALYAAKRAGRNRVAFGGR